MPRRERSRNDSRKIQRILRTAFPYALRSMNLREIFCPQSRFPFLGLDFELVPNKALLSLVTRDPLVTRMLVLVLRGSRKESGCSQQKEIGGGEEAG
jgi:hypothetical protein